jgi:hypothetical protein
MRYWLAGSLSSVAAHCEGRMPAKERPALFRDLPESFKIGQPLPVHSLIRNNQSRVGGLDYVVKTGTIVEAVENQPWSGEANVHVSIANWVKTQDAALLPKTRKLWFKIEPSAAAKKLRKHGSGPASKEYELDVRECDQIMTLRNGFGWLRLGRALRNRTPRGKHRIRRHRRWGEHPIVPARFSGLFSFHEQ